jgi:hypothetical protein
MIAHIGPVPLEELLPLAYGATALWAVARLKASEMRRRIR